MDTNINDAGLGTFPRGHGVRNGLAEDRRSSCRRLKVVESIK